MLTSKLQREVANRDSASQSSCQSDSANDCYHLAFKRELNLFFLPTFSVSTKHLENGPRHSDSQRPNNSAEKRRALWRPALTFKPRNIQSPLRVSPILFIFLSTRQGWNKNNDNTKGQWALNSISNTGFQLLAGEKHHITSLLQCDKRLSSRIPLILLDVRIQQKKKKKVFIDWHWKRRWRRHRRTAHIAHTHTIRINILYLHKAQRLSVNKAASSSPPEAH